MGDTDQCPWDMGTFGSMSIKYFGPSLRAAAAEAKAVLIQMAAEQLRLPADQLKVKDGMVADIRNPRNKISYADLAKGKRIERHLDHEVTLNRYLNIKCPVSRSLEPMP